MAQRKQSDPLEATRFPHLSHISEGGFFWASLPRAIQAGVDLKTVSESTPTRSAMSTAMIREPIRKTAAPRKPMVIRKVFSPSGKMRQ